MGVAVAAGRESLKATVRVAREVGVELRRDRVTDMSAQIAFWGILSLFPGLLAIAAALGSLEVLIEVCTDLVECFSEHRMNGCGSGVQLLPHAAPLAALPAKEHRELALRACGDNLAH